MCIVQYIIYLTIILLTIDSKVKIYVQNPKLETTGRITKHIYDLASL